MRKWFKRAPEQHLRMLKKSTCLHFIVWWSSLQHFWQIRLGPIEKRWIPNLVISVVVTHAPLVNVYSTFLMFAKNTYFWTCAFYTHQNNICDNRAQSLFSEMSLGLMFALLSHALARGYQHHSLQIPSETQNNWLTLHHLIRCKHRLLWHGYAQVSFSIVFDSERRLAANKCILHM